MGEYTITYADPTTGKERRGTISSSHALSETELSQLTQYTAEQYGVPLESVKIGQKGAPTKAKEVPWGQKAVTTVAEALPYAALGLVNPGAATLAKVPAIGSTLAAHPALVGGALRSLGAGAIGGVEGALEGKDPWQSAKSSGMVQGALEAITPPLFKFGARLGGGAMRKLEDSIAGKLMSGIKNAVPWFKALPESHEGVKDLIVSGKGPELLSKNYGAALADVKALIGEQATMELSVADAKALKIATGDMIPNVPAAYAGKGLTAEQAAQLGVPVTTVQVPTLKVIDSVKGVWQRDPSLSHRTLEAIDNAVPPLASELYTEARRLFREGTNFIKNLKATHLIDERTGRVSAERLTMGSRALFGESGEAGASIAERYKAPVASKIIQDATPTGKAPHAVGPGKAYVSPTGHMGIGGHGGGESVQSVLTQTQPSLTLFSENIPLTAAENKAQQLTPGLIHAGAKALGVSP